MGRWISFLRRLKRAIRMLPNYSCNSLFRENEVPFLLSSSVLENNGISNWFGGISK